MSEAAPFSGLSGNAPEGSPPEYGLVSGDCADTAYNPVNVCFDTDGIGAEGPVTGGHLRRGILRSR